MLPNDFEKKAMTHVPIVMPPHSPQNKIERLIFIFLDSI